MNKPKFEDFKFPRCETELDRYVSYAYSLEEYCDELEREVETIRNSFAESYAQHLEELVDINEKRVEELQIALEDVREWLMNKMKEVAELLGVQLNEEFCVIGFEPKLTFKFTENGLMVKCSSEPWSEFNNVLKDFISGEYEIVKKPILSKQEKEYLENVLRPFKDKVGDITKFKNMFKEGFEYIRIRVPDETYIIFPKFEIDSMYKGMELEKNYSLKELGLFED